MPLAAPDRCLCMLIRFSGGGGGFWCQRLATASKGGELFERGLKWFVPLLQVDDDLGGTLCRVHICRNLLLQLPWYFTASKDGTDTNENGCVHTPTSPFILNMAPLIGSKIIDQSSVYQRGSINDWAMSEQMIVT